MCAPVFSQLSCNVLFSCPLPAVSNGKLSSYLEYILVQNFFSSICFCFVRGVTSELPCSKSKLVPTEADVTWGNIIQFWWEVFKIIMKIPSFYLWQLVTSNNWRQYCHNCWKGCLWSVYSTPSDCVSVVRVLDRSFALHVWCLLRFLFCLKLTAQLWINSTHIACLELILRCTPLMEACTSDTILMCF